MPYPKIELHVHLEGTVRPARLLEIARRNGVALPAASVAELAALYAFRDFAHFIEVWIMTTRALRRERDFRQIVVDYVEEAAAFGAVYIEGIFSPAERVKYGPSWDEVFTGFCDGGDEARERFGVEVRLTPDIPRDLDGDVAEGAALTVRYAAKYRDQGVVGVGLGGLEVEHPPEPFAPAFRRAKELGLGSVPHAGEVAGTASIRGAIDALGADRLRHGIRAVDDADLVAELADRGIVLDVCPVSNVRTGAVASLDAHPLPTLVESGVWCTIGSDDPAMFDTDLGREHDAARALGVDPRHVYDAGVLGALCDDETKHRLRSAAAAAWWPPS
jgi:aminodeoxyfutalosine deaminase